MSDFMRSRDEIELAHTVLEHLLSGKTHELDDTARFGLSGQLHVLCWILGHDQGESFGDNVTRALAQLKDLGITPYWPERN